MYAYRKPLTAGTFEGLHVWGIDYKVILVVSQVLGYLTAKLVGIKLISEMKPHRRGLRLLALIGMSHLALLLFALTPFPYNFGWLFFNGLPLGMIWGIVFTYIEGRKATDILATFLSISFIVSSGFVKSIGRMMIQDWGVSDFWMPFAVGCVFLPLVLLSTWMMEKIPPPTMADRQARSPRVPLLRPERRQLFGAYAVGLGAILAVNMVMTVGRDIKDNFLVEIFDGVGMDMHVGIYTQTETIVGLIVLGLLSLMVLVQQNLRAFFLIHAIMLLGFATMVLGTYFLSEGRFNPMTCMIIHGVGLYTSYIVFQSVYFERFIATFKISGNVGYLIYLSDFVGYVVSCTVLIAKDLLGFSTEWGAFFLQLSYGVGILGMVMVVISTGYFARKIRGVNT